VTTQEASNKKSSRRAGRPIGTQETRGNILDVAEQVFAAFGYSATSLRDIASRAQINPALITYYFGSKQNLFETVFKRRGSQIADRWTELLDGLEQRSGRPPTVRELIHAYLLPQFEMKSSGPGGLAFVRLQARLHNEPEEFDFRLRREVYDVSTKRYIAALERALPNVDPADVNWRMVFLIGTHLYMLSGVDRLSDLSDGRYESTDINEVVARLSNFLMGGMTAPTTQLAP
jgi:AcrR family transcriptional regulator